MQRTYGPAGSDYARVDRHERKCGAKTIRYRNSGGFRENSIELKGAFLVLLR